MAQSAQATAVPRPTPAWTATFSHALAFVLGFGTIFTLLGSAAGLLGHGLTSWLFVIQKLGAVLLVIFGLVTIGVFRWLVNFVTARTDLAQNPAAAALVDVLNFFNTLLYTERRVAEMHNVKQGLGYMSSFLMGVSFSAGWVPCIGPILASILFLASDTATVGTGAGLLAIYSLGLGIPFLLTGLAFSSATSFLRRLNRHANIVSLISGLFLLVVAFFLWTDRLGALTNTFSSLNTFALGLEENISLMFGLTMTLNTSLLSGAPLAFIAGVISFISPCVLPLVPAYIGYLSGASLGGARSS